MSNFSLRACLMFLCLVVLLLESVMAIPRPQPQEAQHQRQLRAVEVNAEDLDTGAEAVASEKDDLQGSSSIGYGYYSSPYLGGYYGGGYYPFYSTYLGGFGYPYYGGYYGGLHSYHGHYF